MENMARGCPRYSDRHILPGQGIRLDSKMGHRHRQALLHGICRGVCPFKRSTKRNQRGSLQTFRKTRCWSWCNGKTRSTGVRQVIQRADHRVSLHFRSFRDACFRQLSTPQGQSIVSLLRPTLCLPGSLGRVARVPSDKQAAPRQVRDDCVGQRPIARTD